MAVMTISGKLWLCVSAGGIGSFGICSRPLLGDVLGCLTRWGQCGGPEKNNWGWSIVGWLGMVFTSNHAEMLMVMLNNSTVTETSMCKASKSNWEAPEGNRAHGTHDPWQRNESLASLDLGQLGNHPPVFLEIMWNSPSTLTGVEIKWHVLHHFLWQVYMQGSNPQKVSSTGHWDEFWEIPTIWLPMHNRSSLSAV